jgi:glycine/betaine/sarcosine/D-proline reductase family selenoprotein B
VVQVTSVLPVAKMVGSNRVVQGGGIVHVLGDPDLPPAEEKALRQKLLQQALETLKKEADGP